MTTAPGTRSVYREFLIEEYILEEEPFYVPVSDEIELFEAAYKSKIPVLLKGPTGCGKTRFIEHMAWRLGRPLTTVRRRGRNRDNGGSPVPLITIACHEDLTASDLVGRYLLEGEETKWIDGPLTRAVKAGAICYLDEIVEARKDTTVLIHPLTDHRRLLPIEKRGQILQADEGFLLCMSYNPGYQSIRKNLKPSTKQRFVALDFGYPPPEKERIIIAKESGVDESVAQKLVTLGNDIRNISNIDLEEGVSTRGLVHAAKLVRRGIDPKRACSIAIAQAVTDEREEIEALKLIIDRIFR